MKKYVNFAIRTILGMLTCYVIFYLFLMIDMNLLTWAACFIIPLGGIVFGMIIGAWSRSGIANDNQPFTHMHAIVLTIVGIVLILTMTHLDYTTCYVTRKREISRTFNGSHISNYELDGKPMDFKEYFDANYSHAEMSLSIKGNRSNPISLGDPGLSGLIYFLQYLAIIGVSIICAKTVCKLPKCEKCGKYYKKKAVDSFKAEKTAEEVGRAFCAKICQPEKYKKEKSSSYGSFYRLVVKYCPDCKTGLVSVYLQVRDGKNFKEIHQVSYRLDECHLVRLGLIKGDDSVNAIAS